MRSLLLVLLKLHQCCLCVIAVHAASNLSLTYTMLQPAAAESDEGATDKTITGRKRKADAADATAAAKPGKHR